MKYDFQQPHLFDITINTPLTREVKGRLADVEGRRIRLPLVEALLDIATIYNSLEGLAGRVRLSHEDASWEVRYARKQHELRVTFPLKGAGPKYKRFSHSLKANGRRHKIRVTQGIIARGWSWDTKTRTLTHSSGKTEIVP